MPDLLHVPPGMDVPVDSFTDARADHGTADPYLDGFDPELDEFFDPSVDDPIPCPQDDDCAQAVDRLVHRHQLEAHGRKVARVPRDYNKLRSKFCGMPVDIIERTFDCTTQFYQWLQIDNYRKHFRTRTPAANVKRRNEPVATDTFMSDTPAVDNGCKYAQIFVGRESLVTDIYPIPTDKAFVDALEDNIRKRGAMDKLISDRAKSEISNRVKDILRSYHISDYQSEPKHQHQNFAERRYQTVKKLTNRVLDRSGAPPNCWLLAVLYVVFILNRLATQSLDWRTPLEKLTGETPDISPILKYDFYEPVYFATDAALETPKQTTFPSGIHESPGYFVGFGDNVGDALTYKILTKETQKIIFRSNVRTALSLEDRNKRLDDPDGESVAKPIVQSTRQQAYTMDPVDNAIRDIQAEQLPATFDPAHLPDSYIGRSYLTQPTDEGERFRATMRKKVVQTDGENTEETPSNIKFLVSVDRPNIPDEIRTYGELLEIFTRQNEDDNDPEAVLWRYKSIKAHQGPIKKGHKDWKGSAYNVLVEWETGEETYEPLHVIAADDPVTCAIYAKRNNLLNTPGWKRFKTNIKNTKKLIRVMKQARLKSYNNTVVYQYGFKVPKTPEQAIQFDLENGNTLWQDAMKLEMEMMKEYQVFESKGIGGRPPSADYRKIRVHFVFAVKHDGRHKARLVAGGHLTPPPATSVYSGVVSLRSLRLVIFLAELNDLQLWGGDIGQAYLEAKTKEKLYIVAGKGFGDLEGHTLIIYKALYGLRTSGIRWHERFADTLRDLGFKPSKADPDVWYRKHDGWYEYIAVYVDDLAIASKDPKEIIRALKEDHKYKLKGVGEISFHLGCDFGRDPDGTLWFGPRKYVGKMMQAYERMFGALPKSKSSPLDHNDHPELDETEILSDEDRTKYQSMIGALQWAVSLGRYNLSTAVMTMSRFRQEPRVGHLERVKGMYGYLRKYKDGAIRVRTGEPDHGELPEQDHDWLHSVYGDVQELHPHDAPEPQGKSVTLTTYVDANLFHDHLPAELSLGSFI